MAKGSPGIRIVDKTKQKPKERAVSEKPPPQQRQETKPKKGAPISKSQFSRLEKEQQQTNRLLRELIKVMKPSTDDCRKVVREMVAAPGKYENNVTDADYHSRLRANTRFYDLQGDYDDHPPKVQLSWKHAETLRHLRDDEVAALESRGFLVLEDPDNDALTGFGRYAYSIEKSHRHLWLSIRKHDGPGCGYAWKYAVGVSPKTVNDPNKTTWVHITDLFSGLFRFWPKMGTTDPLCTALRESMAVVHFVARDLGAPRELQETEAYQADVYLLIEKALENLQSSEELRDEVIAGGIKQLDPRVVEARRIQAQYQQD